MMAGISTANILNSGKLTYFEFFSLFLAGLVCFAITFALLYLAKWKFRYWFDPKYAVTLQNLEEEFRRVKREDGESSDEDKMDEMLNSYYHDNEQEIGQNLDRHRALEKTLAKIRLDDKPEDSDDDVFEFEDAKVEETEDKLVLEFNKKQDFLSKEEIEMITQEVSELDISRDIMMMISKRHMSKNNLKTINEAAEDREESES